MTGRQRQHRHRSLAAASSYACGAALLLALLPGAAQDIRGLEVCTAERQMERRTGCLQANIEFLQQALSKLARENQDKMAAAARDLAAARTEIAASRAEIAALKAALAKLDGEVAHLKAKAEAGGKK